jgi:hypothetical protein
LDQRYFTKLGTASSSGASSIDYQVKAGVVMPDSLTFSIFNKENLLLAKAELRFEDYDAGEVIDPPVNAIGAIIESVSAVDPYRPRGGHAALLPSPELKVMGRRPGEITTINRYSQLAEPCLLVEVRGAEKTVHYIGKDFIGAGDQRYSFRDIRNSMFMGVVNIQAWVNFLFEGNIRCGICAKTLPVLGQQPEHSPIKEFVRQLRDFVRTNFRAR